MIVKQIYYSVVSNKIAFKKRGTRVYIIPTGIMMLCWLPLIIDKVLHLFVLIFSTLFYKILYTLCILTPQKKSRKEWISKIHSVQNLQITNSYHTFVSQVKIQKIYLQVATNGAGTGTGMRKDTAKKLEYIIIVLHYIIPDSFTVRTVGDSQ